MWEISNENWAADGTTERPRSYLPQKRKREIHLLLILTVCLYNNMIDVFNTFQIIRLVVRN